MKKLAAFMTALLALLYFTSTFFSMGNTNFMNSINAESYFEKINSKGGPLITIGLKYNADEQIQKELFSIFKKKHLTAVGFTATRGREIPNDDIYIYAEKDIYKGQIITKNNERISFCDPKEERYYSTKEGKNAVLIDFLNPMFYNYSKLINLYPFLQAKNSVTPTGITISGINEADFMKEVEGKKVQSFITTIYAVREDYRVVVREGGLQYNSKEILMTSLILCLVSLSLLLIVNVVKQKKYIAIARLNGLSKGKIIKKIFLPFLSVIFITYSITEILLLFFIAGPYRDVSKNLYEVIIASVIGVFIISILLVIFLYLYLSLYNNYHDLKQKKINTLSIQVNVLIKIVMSTMLMVPFISVTIDTFKQTQESMALFKMKNEQMNRYGILLYDSESSMYVNSEDSEKDNAKILSILANEYDGKAYNLAFSYVTAKVNEFKEPYVSVNRKYLKDYVLPLDEKGDEIKVEKLTGGVILVPKRYRNGEGRTLEYVKTFPYQKIIYVEDFKEEFKPLYFQDSQFSKYVKNPIVYVCDEKIPKSLTDIKNSFYINSDHIQKVYDRLAKEGFDNRISFYSLAPNLELRFNKQFITFSAMAFLFTMYLFVYLFFVYQSIFVYLDVFRKKIMIEYLNGYSYWKRYYQIYLINACAYVIAGVSAYYFYEVDLKSILLYILFFAGMEVLFEVYQIHHFEKKEGIESLK